MDRRQGRSVCFAAGAKDAARPLAEAAAFFLVKPDGSPGAAARGLRLAGAGAAQGDDAAERAAELALRAAGLSAASIRTWAVRGAAGHDDPAAAELENCAGDCLAAFPLLRAGLLAIEEGSLPALLGELDAQGVAEVVCLASD